MNRVRNARGAALVIVVIAAAVVAYLVLKGDDNDTSSQTAGGAQATTPQDLEKLAGSVGHPIYWAGQRSDTRLELTVTSDGNVYIRYLDPGTPIGSRQTAALTIGSYPVDDGYAATQQIARRPGSRTARTPDGGLVVTNTSTPTSTYVAYRGRSVQVEVYDPNPAEGFSLATSGEIDQVPSS